MEKTILVSVIGGRARQLEAADSFEELGHLASSAGARVIGQMIQERDSFDPKYLLGRGKVSELARSVSDAKADLVIIDQELTPSQQGNLEEATGVKVLDRTGLILDIFAQRARTKEGRLQVELAQLQYFLPRLVGRHAELSRLGGGIGTRGPGEKKLEVDRRRVRRRMAQLTSELEKVRHQRGLYRRARGKAMLPVVSLVGYTNAGKSTLLHALTGAQVLREDRLFSTLDPTTRRLRLPGGSTALLTDTVGFIRHIPHQLVAAFKSTLEEVRLADLLLHVIDASRPDHQERALVVGQVLAEIGAAGRESLEVYNKIDLLPADEDLARLERRHPEAAFVSAARGLRLEGLLQALEHRLSRPRNEHHYPPPLPGDPP